MSTDDFNSDLDLDTPRPTGAEVAWRALCLASVIMRGQIEAALAENPQNGEAKTAAKRLADFIKTSELARWFSNQEAASIVEPPGSWPRQTFINAHWRFEALAVLLWAIGRIDVMPAFDATVNTVEIPNMVPLLGDLEAVHGFVRKSELRESDALDEMREIAESWHWRARTHARATGMYPTDSDPNELLEYARESASHAGESGQFTPIDGDYPAFGKPYQRVTKEEWQLLISIAQERHYASNWLCGDSADWDNVSLDT
ncbi:MAG: DUF4272 domain-containing protein [Phycisphaerales bacterium]|nr:DUF4272 domain-containing protein [Phycisphaerales bacterium]